MELDSDPLIDWASRADGEEHTLTRGTHYSRPAYKVQHAATMWARRRGLRALTTSTDDTITIRFVTDQGKV